MSQLKFISGFTIKQQLLGEADIILTFFSEEQGKLRLVMKSAKRMTSKLQGGVQPFMKTKLGLVGRGSLQTIISAEPIKQYQDLIGNIHKMHSVLTTQEFLNRALPDAEPNQRLFNLTERYYQFINSLQEISSPDQLRPSLIQYYSQALTAIGFEPELITDPDDQLPTVIFFSITEGGFSKISRSTTDAQVSKEIYLEYKQMFQSDFKKASTLITGDTVLYRLLVEFIGYQFDRKQRSALYFA